MLAIKLQRVGKKGQASFRVIVQEKCTKLQGRSTEDLGWVNPRTDRYEVNKERAAYWLTKGAQPTDTVWNLLVKAGIVRGAKLAVHGKSKAAEEKGKEKKEIGETVAAASSVENQAEGVAPAPVEAPAAAA